MFFIGGPLENQFAKGLPFLRELDLKYEITEN